MLFWAVAKVHPVPVSFDDRIEDGLPEDGWGWAIRRAAHGQLRGVDGLRPGDRHPAGPAGSGLCGRMPAAVRANVAARGFTDLVAPVRPTGARGKPIDAGHTRHLGVRPVPVIGSSSTVPPSDAVVAGRGRVMPLALGAGRWARRVALCGQRSATRTMSPGRTERTTTARPPLTAIATRWAESS
nr:hypothetical protein GCM10020092_019040 [Actinoplanes digitatis]